MKTSLILFASSLLAPAAVMVGIGAAPLVGAATLAGIGAIALQDYGHRPTYAHELTAVKAKPSAEHLPLAA